MNPCHFCFIPYTTGAWEYFKELEIKTLAGIKYMRLPTKSEEQRKGEKDDVLNENILYTEDKIVTGKYYPAWVEGLKNNDKTYVRYNKNKEFYDTSSLTFRCREMIFGALTEVGRANVESVSSLLGVEKASIHYEEHGYYYDDIDDYLKYILAFTHRMIEIYRYVKDVLTEDVKNCLLSLMKRSEYTDFVCEDISDLSITVPDNQRQMSSQPDEGSQSTSPQHTIKIDEDKEHKKWFVKVLTSKYKTNVKDCLSNLYNKLLEDGYIGKETDKDLFIYRFSGIGTPKDLEEVIKWKGPNVLLGYIARCLLSDDKQPPMGLGKVATFFESDSGKKMNLSTEDFSNYDFEKQKGVFNNYFIEAVELLRDCGFCKVEVTKMRWKKKAPKSAAASDKLDNSEVNLS